MCGVCGCGGSNEEPKEAMVSHHHDHSPNQDTHLITVEKDILSKNNHHAQLNRNKFEELSVFAINFLSSPGSGKTTLLVRTINDLKDDHNFFVIEGDQQTNVDAERIRATGSPAIQINTGKGCHLDAHMVGHVYQDLALDRDGILCIENVGNLVCPAAFDLGEATRVVVLSVTEGEDKPLKYPEMFRTADIVLINKSDLLPYLEFSTQDLLTNLEKVNPGIKSVFVSAQNGEGLTEWYQWLIKSRQMAIETTRSLEPL